jgi:hypothetical protein
MSFPPCLALLMQVRKADFDAIYVIPALFGFWRGCLDEQILCIFAVLPPCLALLIHVAKA